MLNLQLRIMSLKMKTRVRYYYKAMLNRVPLGHAWFLGTVVDFGWCRNEK